MRPPAPDTSTTTANARGVPLGEKVLLFLSRDPAAVDYGAGVEKHDLANSLDLLYRVFPGFLGAILGKRVLDFGCGGGYQAAGLAQRGAEHVLGLDTNPKTLAKARELAKTLGLGPNIEFAERLAPHLQKTFDVVISQNSFEHFSDPAKTLEEMKGALNSSGAIYLTFGPPWYAPHGSHMHFFTKVPWVNVLFSERTVMNVRRYFRSDGASHYEEVESGLNRMTIGKFEQIVSDSGMKVVRKNYESVKGLTFLGHMPLVRELFVNRISCVLRF